jgi:arylsulfate sulfotransferase
MAVRSIIRSARFALPAAIWLLLAAGCGVTFAPSGPPKPPITPPPGGPPPQSGGSGPVTLSPQYAALSPGQTIQFSATAGGSLIWLVNGVAGGNASTGTVDSSGNYTAPATLPQSANFTVTAELASNPQQDYATSVVSVINPGVVYPTANPQVVQYSIYLPMSGTASVDFGTTTGYGRETWKVETPTANGGQVDILVAGMLAQTPYHLRARVALSDGATLNDTDHTQFNDGSPLKTGTAPLTSPVIVSGSGTPQPGIEMWNQVLPSNVAQAFATDLNGNVIWTYTYSHATGDIIQGVQLLPNGHLLLLISYLSSLNPPGQADPNLINAIREVDLAGNTVRELSMDTLNQKLAASNLRDSSGKPYQFKSFHHDVLPLPNGHWVLLTTLSQTMSNLQGYSKPTPVLGDALVDVDQNSNPDWVWSAFDHLDINRRPMGFPDWTHSNGLLYSADDHNLLLSIRHQNWIIKIDFNDGHGSGNVLWRLGEGGDFRLVGGTDPTDWFYAQHGMGFFTPNTSGDFRLGVLDNGNDRSFPPPTGQVLCKPGASPSAQCYSTVPILDVNEANRTATLVAHYVPPPSFYSFFGGNVELLANGDVQANFCSAPAGAIVQELDPSASQVVWQATTAKADQFHVDRLPSLYPGVQW